MNHSGPKPHQDKWTRQAPFYKPVGQEVFLACKYFNASPEGGESLSASFLRPAGPWRDQGKAGGHYIRPCLPGLEVWRGCRFPARAPGHPSAPAAPAKAAGGRAARGGGRGADRTAPPAAAPRLRPGTRGGRPPQRGQASLTAAPRRCICLQKKWKVIKWKERREGGRKENGRKLEKKA